MKAGDRLRVIECSAAVYDMLPGLMMLHRLDVYYQAPSGYHSLCEQPYAALRITGMFYRSNMQATVQ